VCVCLPLARSLEQSKRIFTAPEEKQLQGLLSCSHTELGTILDGSSYIFEQSAYHNSTAKKLHELLTKAGVENTRVNNNHALHENLSLFISSTL